jgi:hypothetical protein
MPVPLLGHALHRLLRCGAGVRWAKLDLAWEFGREATWERRFKSSLCSSIPAAAQRRRLGEGGRP